MGGEKGRVEGLSEERVAGGCAVHTLSCWFSWRAICRSVSEKRAVLRPWYTERKFVSSSCCEFDGCGVFF